LTENNDDTLILDGADLAILLIDTDINRLVFTGAGLSLFAARDGKITEYKGNKNGIGYSFGKNAEYADIEIPHAHGSRYYFTTDGFIDQNLQAEKSGIGKKGFVAILEQNIDVTMDGLKTVFETEIDARLRFVPQRDDITIIGIEL